VFVVQLPRDVDRDGVVRALAERGIPSKPYFPAVHLMSFYRETFGYRPGAFPVCEDVASRSIALPFFPEMTEAQVARVAEALEQVLAARVGAVA
jgi:perosamine synthetase